jgi:hypothetical protein
MQQDEGAMVSSTFTLSAVRNHDRSPSLKASPRLWFNKLIIPRKAEG